MTPPVSTPLDLTYGTRAARTVRDEMRAEQDALDIDNPIFTEVDWAQIDLIYPILRDIEESENCKILIAQSHSLSELDPDALLNIAGAEPDSRTVIIARQCYLTPDVSSRSAAEVDDIPALQSLYTEANPGHFREYALNGQTLGLIAPRVIAAYWWWYNSASSPEQLAEIDKTLREAVASALNPEFAEEWATGADARIASQIAQLISARGSEELSAMRNEVPRLMRDITGYEAQITRWQTRLDELRPLISAAESALIQAEDITHIVTTELTQLRAHPDIIGIERGNGNTLRITTRQLPLTNIHTDEVTVAGTFDLSITFGTNANIRVKNLTHAVGLYDHPHVSEGTFCLGDQRRLVESLVVKSELSAAVSLVIDLLKQVNPDDTYTSDWEAWFHLNTEGAS